MPRDLLPAAPSRHRLKSSRLRAGAGLGYGVGIVGLIVVLVAAGCGPTHGQMVEFLKAHDTTSSTGHYTVMPPDAITIHASDAPEIDGVSQRIRPDGKVVFRLLGEVHVAGLTTQELAEKLEAQLSRYYVDPEVVVEVAQYRSQHYYIFGQVQSPGAKLYTGRDMLLKALADARPTFLAWRSRIRVVRPSEDGESDKIITVDLDKMVRSGDTSQNILLQEGDIVEVPPTPLAWIGLRVRELLYPVDPLINAYVRPTDVYAASDEYRGGFNDIEGE